jgi:subtilisin family serine protease
LACQILSTSAADASQNISKQEKEKGFSENEVVVRIESPEKISGLSQRYNLLIIPLSPDSDGTLYLAKSLVGKDARSLVRELKKNPDIKLAQLNYKYKPLSITSNDSYFSEQWYLGETGGVSASSAWESETKSQRNVAIAVIDTGVNPEQRDLKKNLTGGSAKGKNFEYPKKKLSDSDGHGTFLAGIIAAVTNNKRGIAGASFFNHLRVMALRFDFTTAQAISALNYAKSKSVPVVNASWGNYGEEGMDPALRDAIASYPGVFVTASGNAGFNHDGSDPDDKMYPCDFDLPNIVCVAASDQNGNLTDYSDFGSVSVDVAAPGGTDEFDIAGLDKKKNKVTSAEGTSLSTAFVSAEAGLLISKFPNLTSAQVIEIIKNSVDQNASLAGHVSTEGKVNFLKAMQLGANY